MDFDGKYKKDDLHRMINIEKLSYREIGRFYNVSDAYIKKICSKLGIKLVKRSNFPIGWVPHNKGKGNKKCLNCNKEFLSTYSKSKYCGKNCEVEYKTNRTYTNYLENQDKYCTSTKSLLFLKKHIYREQNNCCQICNMNNEWNGKKIVFILDHIDGDAANNRRENLRLVCPNCDSQLDTYKSKNKNSARKERYLLNYKNL